MSGSPRRSSPRLRRTGPEKEEASDGSRSPHVVWTHKVEEELQEAEKDRRNSAKKKRQTLLEKERYFGFTADFRLSLAVRLLVLLVCGSVIAVLLVLSLLWMSLNCFSESKVLLPAVLNRWLVDVVPRIIEVDAWFRGSSLFLKIAWSSALFTVREIVSSTGVKGCNLIICSVLCGSVGVVSIL